MPKVVFMPKGVCDAKSCLDAKICLGAQIHVRGKEYKLEKGTDLKMCDAVVHEMYKVAQL